MDAQHLGCVVDVAVAADRGDRFGRLGQGQVELAEVGEAFGHGALEAGRKKLVAAGAKRLQRIRAAARDPPSCRSRRTSRSPLKPTPTIL